MTEEATEEHGSADKSVVYGNIVFTSKIIREEEEENLKNGRFKSN